MDAQRGDTFSGFILGLAVALARADAEAARNAPRCRWCGSRDLGEDMLGRGTRCYSCCQFQRKEARP